MDGGKGDDFDGDGDGGDIVEKKSVGGRERLRRRIVGVRGGMGGRRRIV